MLQVSQEVGQTLRPYQQLRPLFLQKSKRKLHSEHPFFNYRGTMVKLLAARLTSHHKIKTQGRKDRIRDTYSGLLPEIGPSQLALLFLSFADVAQDPYKGVMMYNISKIKVAHTNNTAFMQPSSSGLLVTCAYLDHTTLPVCVTRPS